MPKLLSILAKVVPQNDQPEIPFFRFSTKQQGFTICVLINNGNVNVIDDSTVSFGQWQHIAATLDSSVMKLFFNGAEADSQLYAGTIPHLFQFVQRRVTIGATARLGWP